MEEAEVDEDADLGEVEDEAEVFEEDEAIWQEVAHHPQDDEADHHHKEVWLHPISFHATCYLLPLCLLSFPLPYPPYPFLDISLRPLMPSPLALLPYSCRVRCVVRHARARR